MKQEESFKMGWERAIRHLSNLVIPILTNKNFSDEKKLKVIKRLFDDCLGDFEKENV